MKRLVQSGYHVIPQWKVGSRSTIWSWKVTAGAWPSSAMGIETYRSKSSAMTWKTVHAGAAGMDFCSRAGQHLPARPDRAMNPVFDKLRSMDISS